MVSKSSKNDKFDSSPSIKADFNILLLANPRIKPNAQPHGPASPFFFPFVATLFLGFPFRNSLCRNSLIGSPFSPLPKLPLSQLSYCKPRRAADRPAAWEGSESAHFNHSASSRKNGYI